MAAGESGNGGSGSGSSTITNGTVPVLPAWKALVEFYILAKFVLKFHCYLIAESKLGCFSCLFTSGLVPSNKFRAPGYSRT